MSVQRSSLSGIVDFSEAEAARYLACGAWMPTTAGDVLRAAGIARPDKAALVGAGRRISYRDYDRLTDGLAASLLRLGLRPGDRALFQMATVPETAIALFACFKAGIIPVCTLPQHRALEIETLGEITRPRAYFVQADASGFDLVGFAQEMGRSIGSLEHLIVARGPAPAGAHGMEAMSEGLLPGEIEETLATVRIDPRDVLLFQISGGTTGIPKVIPRFHAEYLGSCRSWADIVRLGPDDVHLWALPLIHNASMIYHLVPAVLGARTLCLMSRFDPTDFFTLIQDEKVSTTGSIGPIASAILDYKRLPEFDLSSLRVFTTLSRAEVIENHLRRPTITVFGMSEGLITGNPPDASPRARFETIGRPTSAFDEIKLLHPDSETEVSFGQVGELSYRGPSSIRGYYGIPSEDRYTADGFFRTGDLMKAHEIDGALMYSFEGRLKDNIDRGGEKFGPDEIEHLIAGHPTVSDVRVVAMPDPVYGEKACAYVILRQGADCPSLAELSGFLAERGLAKYKIPERIELVDEFPVTRVGKIDKIELRRMIAEKIRSEGRA